MDTQIKLLDNVALWPGEMLYVRDKERKHYTLKYEGVSGKFAIFKQMGRNTTKKITCDFVDVADFIHNQYRKVEKVLKFEGC